MFSENVVQFSILRHRLFLSQLGTEVGGVSGPGAKEHTTLLSYLPDKLY